jgi:molybdopterin-guanine dinucleotide biosynthesis protein A
VRRAASRQRTVAAFAAVVLVAADLPFIGDAVTRLLAGLTVAADVAVLVDSSGRHNYLASAWHRTAVDARPDTLSDPTGRSMQRLLDGLAVTTVTDDGEWAADCDTWDAIEQARQRATDVENAR